MSSRQGLSQDLETQQCMNLTFKVRGPRGPSTKISRGPAKNLGARKIALKLILGAQNKYAEK